MLIKVVCVNELITQYALIHAFSTLKPRQNGRLFADDTFKRIFLNENIRISIEISLKFVPKGLINNIAAPVLIMAWRRPGDKPLSEPMMVRSLTHICITRPQCVILPYFILVLHYRRDLRAVGCLFELYWGMLEIIRDCVRRIQYMYTFDTP